MSEKLLLARTPLGAAVVQVILILVISPIIILMVRNATCTIQVNIFNSAIDSCLDKNLTNTINITNNVNIIINN